MGLLDRSAGGVGRQIDCDVAGRCRCGAAGRDGPAVFDQRHAAALIRNCDGGTALAACDCLDGSAVADRRHIGSGIDFDGSGNRGIRSAAIGAHCAGNADLRHAGAGAQAKCGRACTLRCRGHGARDAHPVGYGHIAAAAANDETIRVNARIDAVACDAAVDDQAEIIGRARYRPDSNRVVGCADDHRRRRTVGIDLRGAFLGILDPVVVFIVVGGAGVLGRNRKDDAAGYIAFDQQGRPALQQIVRVELGGVRGRCGIAIAGGGDRPLHHHCTVHIASEMRTDRVDARGRDGSGEADLAGDVVHMHADAAIAQHDRLAVMGEIAGQRAANPDARGIVAFHGDHAGRSIGDLARMGAVGAYAEAPGTDRKRTVEVTIIVRIGRRIGLIDRDRAAVGDVSGGPRKGGNPDCAIGIADGDRALVGHRMIAVHGDGGASSGFDRTCGSDGDRIRRSGLHCRSLDWRRDGSGNRFRRSRSGERNDGSRSKQITVHRDPSSRSCSTCRRSPRGPALDPCEFF